MLETDGEKREFQTPGTFKLLDWDSSNEINSRWLRQARIHMRSSYPLSIIQQPMLFTELIFEFGEDFGWKDPVSVIFSVSPVLRGLIFRPPFQNAFLLISSLFAF
jgi:hypothetical protein